MVKAKECCCGCSLRDGTQILLWISLVTNSYGTLLYLMGVLGPARHYSYYGTYTSAGLKWREFYFLIWCTFGVVTSTLGIVGIQKNIPKYLNGFLYFAYYECIYYIFLILILIVWPSAYGYVTQWETFSSAVLGYGRRSEFILVLIIGHIFCLALLSYFALIIKSCRDTQLKNKNEHNTGDISDPAAVGYSIA